MTVLLAVGVIACGISIATLSFSNPLARRSEAGILSAMGYGFRHILSLFLSKEFAMGLAGGVLGLAAGLVAGRALGRGLDHAGTEVVPPSGLLNARTAVLALLMAVVLSVLAGGFPSLMAARLEPVITLRGS